MNCIKMLLINERRTKENISIPYVTVSYNEYSLIVWQRQRQLTNRLKHILMKKIM
jgi:hypothetical protein